MDIEEVFKPLKGYSRKDVERFQNTAYMVENDPPLDLLLDMLDCCRDIDVQIKKNLYDDSHDSESIMQCTQCKSFYFKRWMEHCNHYTGEDTIVTWISPITSDEANFLLNKKPIDSKDLKFLETREYTVFMCFTFIAYIHGQPSEPLWVPRPEGGTISTGVEYSKWYPPKEDDARIKHVYSKFD